MNQDSITSALTRMDSTRGVRVSEVVQRTGERPSQSTNRECSKVMLSLGWTKSSTKQREDNERFYLWFPPVITTVQIEQTELNQLRHDNWTMASKILKLEQALVDSRSEVRQLNLSIDGFLDGLREA